VTGVKTGYASGPSKPAQPAKWRITPLLGDGNYRWRARSKDGQNAYSGYTAWFAFSTDSTAPDVPDVGPDDPDVYFEDDGSGVCSGGIGIGGDFDLSGGSSVVHFTWSLDGGAYSSPVPTAGTNPKTATISVRPLKDMVRSLKVRAYDAAGRFGEASYAFRVCSPPPEAGHWKLDGTGNDDVELITVPHHAYDDFVAWPQDRWGPQPRPSEYTVSSGPQAFVPADQTVLALTGDDETLAITLPFPMPFYGQSYTQAWVDTNGLVSLAEHTDSEYWNTPIPSPYPPSLALYPFWDDLVVETDSSVRVATTGTAPNRVFVIEWRNVAFYAESAKRVTFEVQLSETGTITFAYTGLAAGDAREAGGWATVGIENGVGGTAAVHGYNQPLLVSGGGVQFTPTGYEAPPYPDGYHEAQFYGTGAINTPGPVLATGLHPETSQRRSFAVAAWIKVTDTTTYRTAVSQQGTVKSLLELGYQAGSENNYCFSMFESDSLSAVGTRACATSPVVVGEWVHLAGVYDGVAGTMTIYVHHKDADGFVDPTRTEIVTKPFTSVWDATGAFTIGRAIAGAAFVGDVDEVWAWQRAPEQVEIEFLASN
jgi:hypothetical protein